jgi:hypothetical protein
MIRVALSAGHNPNAKGASNGEGFNEYDEASKWITELAGLFAATNRIEIILVPTGSLTSKINFINEQARLKLAIEIHFNSCASTRVKGSETLFCPGSRRGRTAANIIQRAIASIMPPNRGTKEGWYRMDRPGVNDYVGDIDGDESIDAFLVRTKCTALILEPEFIQNKSVIEANRDICCDVIRDAIVEYVTN